MSHPPHSAGEPPIPRGIEVLVKKAAVDAEFRRLLLTDRAEAAEQIGLKLDASERKMLSAVPEAQLLAIIDRTTVPEEQRRAFLGRAAAAMLAVLSTGGSVAAAGFVVAKGGTGGIAPERPMPAPTGSRPDLPEPPDEPTAHGAEPAIVARVADVLSRHTTVAKNEITAAKYVVTDLRISGTAAEAACKSLEAEFGIAVSRASFGELNTVGDLALRVETLAAVSRPALDTIAKQLQVDRGGLGGATTLDGDLSVSRLDRAQLRRRLATQFRVYLDWEEFKQLTTVGDVVDHVARQVQKRNEAAAEKERPKPPSPVSRGSRPDRPMSFGIQPDLPHGSSGFGGVRPH